MRISITGFARICEHDRYAVLLNRGWVTRGKGRILTPIGGGLEYAPATRTFLDALGATNFEGDQRDLRFRIPDHQIDTVVRWFNRREANEREISVRRELVEELTEETGALRPRHLRGATERFVRSGQNIATTSRDVPEKRTLYLMEIFDVTLSRRGMKALERASEVPLEDRWVHFVDDQEIRTGRTREGVAISPITRFIL